MWQLLIIAIIIFGIIGIVPLMQKVHYQKNCKDAFEYRFEQSLLTSHLKGESYFVKLNEYISQEDFDMIKEEEYKKNLP